MKAVRARSAAEIQAAMKSATAAMPPPPVEISERAMVLYAGILAGVPASSRHTVVARALAASIAEAVEEGEVASRILHDEGYTITTGSTVKPHPMLAVRDTAARRAGALRARLKLLPSDDHHEAVRAAAYENSLRGGTTPLVGGEVKDGSSVDWVAVLARETVRENG